MQIEPCPKCAAIINGSSSKNHDDLQRSGFYKSVGHHGSRDDEYYYTCRVCGSTFVGDYFSVKPATDED